MNKSLTILTCMALGAMFVAQADPLLYWMVDQGSGDAIEFSVARVKYINSSDDSTGYLTLVDENGGTSQGILASGGSLPGTSTAATWADLAGMTGSEYTFLVELLASDGHGGLTAVGGSQAKSYNDLVSAGSVAPNALNIGTVDLTAWTGTSYAVPEPSGALLMLVGGSLLALRRRRKIA